MDRRSKTRNQMVAQVRCSSAGRVTHEPILAMNHSHSSLFYQVLELVPHTSENAKENKQNLERHSAQVLLDPVAVYSSLLQPVYLQIGAAMYTCVTAFLQNNFSRRYP